MNDIFPSSVIPVEAPSALIWTPRLKILIMRNLSRKSVNYDAPHVIGEVERIVKAEKFRSLFWKESRLFGHLPGETAMDSFLCIWDSIETWNALLQESWNPISMRHPLCQFSCSGKKVHRFCEATVAVTMSR
jgi:hypothetical protein